jgi:hypothetical protein
MKIGIVGFSAQKFDITKAKMILLEELSKLPEGSEVVSGLTYLGIPGLAYDVAESLGIKTVGVACEKAYNYPCFEVDEEYIVGAEWGDESKTFLDYCDAILRIGGGKQSFAEVEEARSMGKPVIEYDMEAI